MKQLKHFGIRKDNSRNYKDLSPEQYKQLYEWEKDDPSEELCDDCYKNKKVPGYDLCLSCGRKSENTKRKEREANFKKYY